MCCESAVCRSRPVSNATQRPSLGARGSNLCACRCLERQNINMTARPTPIYARKVRESGGADGLPIASTRWCSGKINSESFTRTSSSSAEGSNRHNPFFHHGPFRRSNKEHSADNDRSRDRRIYQPLTSSPRRNGRVGLQACRDSRSLRCPVGAVNVCGLRDHSRHSIDGGCEGVRLRASGCRCRLGRC